MSLPAAAALLTVAAILQSTLLPHFAINGVKPNLVLVLVAGWSLLRGAKEGALWALVGGIVCDFLSGAPFGLCTFSLLAVSILSGVPSLRAFHSAWLLPILMAAASALVYDGVSLLSLHLQRWPVSWWNCLVYVTLPGAAFTALLAPFVFGFLRSVNRRAVSLSPAESEEMAW